MADDVIINAGSGGATIATDDVGGKQHQRIKLTMGADGVNDGDVAVGNPLPVRGYAFSVTQSVTRPADTTAYTSGDCFSDSTSAPTSGGFLLSSVARVTGGGGVLTDLMISSTALSAMQGRIWLFNQAVTNANDNASLSLSDGDLLNCIGAWPFTLAVSANNSFCHLQNLAKAFVCSGSPDLRFLIEVTAAYTPTSAETLRVRAMGLQAT